MSHDPTVEMSIVDKVGIDGVIYRNNSTQDCYVLDKVLLFSAASGFLVVLIVERGINHPSTQPVEHFAQKPWIYKAYVYRHNSLLAPRLFKQSKQFLAR